MSTNCITLQKFFDPSICPSRFRTDKKIIQDGDSGYALTKNEIWGLSTEVSELLWDRLEGKIDENLAVVLPNVIEYPIVFLGIANIRSCNCLLNPNLKKDEYVFALEDMGCSLMLTFQNSPALAAEEAAKDVGIPIIRLHLDREKQMMVFYEGDTKIERASTNRESSDVQGSDICLRLHTSGTTSRPKTVAIPHANFCFTMMNIFLTYRWEAKKDVGLLVMPLFHVHGLLCGLFSPMLNNAKIVFAGGSKFHASTFWDDVKKYDVTWATMVPSMIQILTFKPELGLPNKLKFVRSCSAALELIVAEKFQKYFETPVCEAYAMTEACHQMAANIPTNTKLGCCGIPTGTEIIVVKKDSTE